MTTRKTPREIAQDNGLKNLSVVAKLTGIAPRTLDKWCHERPDLFKVIIAGTVALNAGA